MYPNAVEPFEPDRHGRARPHSVAYFTSACMYGNSSMCRCKNNVQKSNISWHTITSFHKHKKPQTKQLQKTQNFECSCLCQEHNDNQWNCYLPLDLLKRGFGGEDMAQTFPNNSYSCSCVYCNVLLTEVKDL